jgi:hypothetical protein
MELADISFSTRFRSTAEDQFSSTLMMKSFSRASYQSGRQSELEAEYQHSGARGLVPVFLCSLLLLLAKG